MKRKLSRFSRRRTKTLLLDRLHSVPLTQVRITTELDVLLVNALAERVTDPLGGQSSDHQRHDVRQPPSHFTHDHHQGDGHSTDSAEKGTGADHRVESRSDAVLVGDATASPKDRDLLILKDDLFGDDAEHSPGDGADGNARHDQTRGNLRSNGENDQNDLHDQRPEQLPDGPVNSRTGQGRVELRRRRSHGFLSGVIARKRDRLDPREDREREANHRSM